MLPKRPNALTGIRLRYEGVSPSMPYITSGYRVPSGPYWTFSFNHLAEIRSALAPGKPFLGAPEKPIHLVIRMFV